MVVTEDWTNPNRIPLGHIRRARHGAMDPETIQANLFTLAQIGGVYDLLALEVERRHAELLREWRLDTRSCSVIDYLEARDTRVGNERNP